MEYQNSINLFDNTSNQPSKFRKVEINDNSSGTCNTNTQIKFEVTMLKSIFCDYKNAYILVNGL